jgi:hypothetical protein
VTAQHRGSRVQGWGVGAAHIEGRWWCGVLLTSGGGELLPHRRPGLGVPPAACHDAVPKLFHHIGQVGAAPALERRAGVQDGSGCARPGSYVVMQVDKLGADRATLCCTVSSVLPGLVAPGWQAGAAAAATNCSSPEVLEAEAESAEPAFRRAAYSCSFWCRLRAA